MLLKLRCIAPRKYMSPIMTFSSIISNALTWVSLSLFILSLLSEMNLRIQAFVYIRIKPSISSVKNKVQASSSFEIFFANADGPGVVFDIFSASLLPGGWRLLTESPHSTGILDGVPRGCTRTFDGPGTLLLLSID